MYLVKENEVYKREREKQFELKEIITFKLPKESKYTKEDYDWYMTVALEKCDKVVQDRHKLTKELLLSYRWAIREGFNHGLDSALQNRYDYPRNQNTISGIEKYIERIKKASQKEMEGLDLQ